jgi:hypothetical protein
MTGPVDLHALANAPGFGAAYRELVKAGAVDPYAEAGPVRKFTVTVSAEARVEALIVVKARCQEEADALARAKAFDGRVVSWRERDITDFVVENTFDHDPPEGDAT